MDSNSEPLDYETVALTTLSPHLPLTHGTSLEILFSTQDKFTGTPTIQSLTRIDNYYLDSFLKSHTRITFPRLWQGRYFFCSNFYRKALKRTTYRARIEPLDHGSSVHVAAKQFPSYVRKIVTFALIDLSFVLSKSEPKFSNILRSSSQSAGHWFSQLRKPSPCPEALRHPGSFR